MTFYGAPFPPNETDSWPTIVEILKYAPTSMVCTSSQRSSGNDWHVYGMAADFAKNFGVTDATAMRDVAKWLYDNYSDWFLELIHTTPFDTDNGFYVKNGQRISSYGADTDAAHLSHIHVAMSYKGATELLKVIKARAGTTPTPTSPSAPYTGTNYAVYMIPARGR